MGAFVKPLGVFGEFAQLTVCLDEAVTGRIFLRDLCRDGEIDVTELVAADPGKLSIRYEELRSRGWLDNDPGDLSAPGFMLWQSHS